MDKIKITINELGQPIGVNARKLSSAIGCQVRKKLSVGCHDWRLVDAKKKLEVWNDMKVLHCMLRYPLSYISVNLETH